MLLCCVWGIDGLPYPVIIADTAVGLAREGDVCCVVGVACNAGGGGGCALVVEVMVWIV